MAINLSLQPAIMLPDDPGESATQVVAATTAWQQGQLTGAAYRARLQAIAAQHPTALTAWAALGELALPEEAITAYAFFRVGYHRGLDRARANGWNGSQQLPWKYESNRGFLRCLHGLLQAATAIHEEAEITRIRQFLCDLDPATSWS